MKNSLGRILVEQGWASELVVRKALNYQIALKEKGRQKGLGTILLQSGTVSRENIEKAVEIQNKTVQQEPIRTREALVDKFGTLHPVHVDPEQSQPFVEGSAARHILLTVNDEGYPHFLLTSAGRKSHVNAFLSAKNKAAAIYRDKADKPIKPFITHVTSDVIDLFRSTGDSDKGGVKTSPELEFEMLIRHAYEVGASDVHFFRMQDECRIRLRVWGAMRNYTGWTPKKADDLISVGFTSFGQGGSNSHWKKQQKQRVRIRVVYDQFVTIDGRYEHSPGDDGTYHACIRLLPNDKRDKHKLIDLEGLGFTAAQAKLLRACSSKASGAVILSGPTGSGKSTTLAALIKWLNKNDDVNILTVESPVERQLPAFQTTVSDDDDADPKEFADAIKSTLRRDPDVLMVGEIRDHYSAEAAVSGVQTGHMLLTSIHAQSGIEIVERMASSALRVPTQTIGSPSFISALVFQMLLPKLDEKTKTRLSPENMRDHLSADLINRIHKVVPDINQANLCVRGRSEENPEGISGMTICAEVIAPDMIMRSHFRRQELTEALTHWRKNGKRAGDKKLADRVVGFTAQDHAIQKMIAGQIDPRDVEAYFGLLSLQQIMDDGVFEESEAPELFTDEDEPTPVAIEDIGFSVAVNE